MSGPAEHGLPCSAWSLVKLSDFLVAGGMVDDISNEGPRAPLREESVSFPRVKTWKTSRDPVGGRWAGPSAAEAAATAALTPPPVDARRGTSRSPQGSLGG
ncbi:hypothetical protein PUR30_06060 [Streptomyces sp. JV190]|nr:hypothetical protein [Streptomyces sp. JV190]